MMCDLRELLQEACVESLQWNSIRAAKGQVKKDVSHILQSKETFVS